MTSVRYQAGGAGWYVVLDGADGRDYFFAHCTAGSVAVVAGAPVAAGTPLCGVGMTGSATGPHLHFEIWDGRLARPGRLSDRSAAGPPRLGRLGYDPGAPGRPHLVGVC